MLTISHSPVFCVLLLMAHGKAVNSLLIVSVQKPVSLQPLYVLQCHSKQDNPEDFGTQLWACAFEPTNDNRSEYLQMQLEQFGVFSFQSCLGVVLGNSWSSVMS